jgi:hypothetical protein
MNVMTREEAALFTCFSVGTSQQGVCPKCREGYEASILAWTRFRSAWVGTLCCRNLDHHSLTHVSTGLRLLTALAIICR